MTTQKGTTMDLEIPDVYIVRLCDRCGKKHASIRDCEDYLDDRSGQPFTL